MTAAAARSLAARLTKRIILITTTVFVVAIIGVGIVSLYAVSNESKENATGALNNSILEIEKVLTEVESSTNIMAWVARNAKLQNASVEVLTSEMLASDSVMVACAIAYEPYAFNDTSDFYMPMSSTNKETGQIETQVIGSNEYDYLTMDWYQIPKLTGKPYWNEPVFDAGGSQRMIASYSMPLYDGDGNFYGVIRSDIELEWLADVINRFQPYETAATLIIGRSGEFITHADKSKILNETIFTDAIGSGNQENIDKVKEIMNGGSGITRLNLGEDKLIAVYAPLLNGWVAVGVCSKADYLEPATRINVILYLVAIIGLIALYFASRKTISRVTQPITEFTYSAMNMSRGNFHATIPEVNSQDEIKRLSDSLSYLQSTINRYIAELKMTTSTKERIESELTIASRIQMSMLPHVFPQHDAFDIYANLIPAKEIGGDLYDIIHDGKYLYFTVGDVSGKGVPAALFMSITRSAFRFVSGLRLTVAEGQAKINDNFSESNETGMFVTMFSAKLNIETLEMEYCNAGHNPIVIVSPDGKARYLNANPNIAAGLFPGFPYIGETLQLEKGTRLIIYTDGVTEAETKRKDQYGEDRLLAFANSIDKNASSKDVVDNLMKSVKEFTTGNDQNDDITILTLTV